MSSTKTSGSGESWSTTQNARSRRRGDPSDECRDRDEEKSKPRPKPNPPPPVQSSYYSTQPKQVQPNSNSIVGYPSPLEGVGAQFDQTSGSPSKVSPPQIYSNQGAPQPPYAGNASRSQQTSQGPSGTGSGYGSNSTQQINQPYQQLSAPQPYSQQMYQAPPQQGYQSYGSTNNQAYGDAQNPQGNSGRARNPYGSQYPPSSRPGWS